MYIDSDKLDQTWDNYQQTHSDESWKKLCEYILLMTKNIIKKYPNMRDADEIIGYASLACISKIERGKLIFNPKRGPAFRLLTTTIRRLILTGSTLVHPKTIKNYRVPDVDESNKVDEEDWLEELRDKDDYYMNCLIEIMFVSSHKNHTTSYWQEALKTTYNIDIDEELITLKIKKICAKMIVLGCRDGRALNKLLK